MPSKRIDELTTRVVANTDLLPPTPSGGPSGSATVAATVRAGLQQPNSASAGAGADITISAADGVTSGAGGSIILEPGAQATTGGDGSVIIRQPGGTAGTNEVEIFNDGTNTNIRSKTGLINILARASASNNIAIFQITSRLNDRYMFRVTDNGATEVGECRIGRDEGSGFTTYLGLNSGDSTFRIINTLPLVWTSGNFSNAYDIGLIRGSVEVLRLTDGSTGGGSLAYTASTPAALTANQNNYVLTGSAFQRINCTTASNITGIAPPTNGAHVDGRMIKVFNVGTANLTLKHNDSNSTAANRMFSSTGSDLVLSTNDYADCVYDSTDNGSGAAGWRIS